jgi:hypothetical protein
MQIGGKAFTCERGACDNKVPKQLSGQTKMKSLLFQIAK